jgi:hypothetical protein
MEAPSAVPFRSGRCGTSAQPEFLAPRSLAAVRELAQLIACAEWAPDSYRDLEGNYSVAKIELAIMQGAVVGLGPIASVQSIALIDGKPAIWGDGALAVVTYSGLLDDMAEEYVIDDDEGLTAISTLRRRHRPTPIVGRFSLAMAETAQLTQKEGPWRSYPRRMLMMRARSWALRDGFADVLRGLALREEVEDYAAGSRRFSFDRPTSWEGGETPQQWSPRPRFNGTSCVSQRTTKDEPSENVAAVAPVSLQAGSPASTEQSQAGASDATLSEPAAPDLAAETVPQNGEHVTGSTGTMDDMVYALVDVEGSTIEVTGLSATQVSFEGLFDRHLTPAQILGLWESNTLARAVIGQRRGEAALADLSDRVAMARDVYEKQQRRREPSSRISRRMNRNGHVRMRSSLVNPDSFQLAIDPGWAEARVFRVYRRRLRDLQNGRAGTATAIATFREVNAPVEARLRKTLPQLMGEIDTIYRWAATNAR